MSLEEAIARRKSVRGFTAEPVSRAQLAQLLWAGYGIQEGRKRDRTVPSAGAAYPLKVFAVCGKNTVELLAEGIYCYNTDSHTLTPHQKGDMRASLSRAALGQSFIEEAPLDIVICAEYGSTIKRYGNRAERYVHMEVGHVGQNVYLQATALGLASVVVGAFSDEQVREVLGKDEQCRPLYIIPVGKPV